MLKIATEGMIRLIIFFTLSLFVTVGAYAQTLHEPHMRIAVSNSSSPQVALTLDACSGSIDMRILDTLIEHRIKATIFITGRWIKSNEKAVKLLNQNSDLFQIENHGANHVPAIIGKKRPYGIKPAGTAKAVLDELIGGELAIKLSTNSEPVWFRGATALYSNDAIELIEQHNYFIAGFSLNGDIGASASAKATAFRIANANNGDVIIAHINQPKRAAGAGVVKGLLALVEKGFEFVRLDEVEVVGE